MTGRVLRLGAAALLLGSALACGDKKEQPLPPGEIQPIAHMDLDSSRTIEVIGLRRWTIEMVRDSLKKYAPDEGLDSDAGAANLRNLLGFADAATTINTVVFDEDEKTTITVAVREPQDSARVHYAPQELDTLPERPEWKPITTEFVGDSNVRLVHNLASAHLQGPSRLVVDSTVRRRKITHREGYAFESPADSLAARPILAQLATRATDADLAAAIETIEKSSSGPDRTAAVLILANFPKRDEAWRTLLKAAVGREQARDAATAQQALIAMSDRFARVVDWSPMMAVIHDVLDGTALAALAPLATALASTGASPAQAKAHLANGGEMLVASIESDNPEIRDPAHRLLVALNGADLGMDPAPWKQWIATLSSPPVPKP